MVDRGPFVGDSDKLRNKDAPASHYDKSMWVRPAITRIEIKDTQASGKATATPDGGSGTHSRP
jgi:hypothetical protein